jgi:hypothetical protein
MKYTEFTRLRDLLADPQAAAILEKHLPGARQHPQLDLALDMSLREIAWYPESGLTADKLQAIVRELAQLG